MFRRFPALRGLSARSMRRASANPRASLAPAAAAVVELLESRVLLNASFDITGLTAMRNDPTLSSINGQGVGIALLDSGIYAKNPDLVGNVKAFVDIANQGPNAPVDPNFINDAFDNVGHGTHTAGTAASTNPSIGVADKAGIIELRVGDESIPNTRFGDPIFDGLVWVANHASQYNIKVVNMSIGPFDNVNAVPPLDPEGQEIQVLEGMGITVVTADGNSYADFAAPGETTLAAQSTIAAANTWPDNGIGTYNFTALYGDGNPYVAFENSATPDTFSAGSQRSSLSNQIAAPGSGILSTWNKPGQLHNFDTGTSMSAPFISGAVALMQQAAKQFGGSYLDPQTILQLMRSSADQIPDPTLTTNGRRLVNPDGSLGPPVPLPGTNLTYSRINVHHAVQAVKQFVQGGGAGADNNSNMADAISTPPLNGISSFTETGNIGTDGQVIVGTKDVDLYKLTLQTSGTLTIASSLPPGGVVVNTTLRVFDSSGTEILSAVGANGVAYPVIQTLSNQPVAAGTYYVGVSSTGNNTYTPVPQVPPSTNNSRAGISTGDYQLNISLQTPDPGGIPAAARVLSFTPPTTTPAFAPHGNLPFTQVSGVIGAPTASDGSVTPFADGDVQFYTFVAPDSGNLIVQAQTGNPLPQYVADVEVFNQAQSRVATNNGLGTPLTVPVQIGQTYYVGITYAQNKNFAPNDPFSRVVASTQYFVPYTMFLAFDNGDANGTVAQATPSVLSTPISGSIGSDTGSTFLGANGGYKDVDFYSITVPSAGIFKATASGAGGLVPEMSIWNTTSGINSAKRLVDANTTDFTVYEQVTAGQTVLLAITGKGNQNFDGLTLGSGAGGLTGAYTLNTSLQPLSTLATLSNNSITANTPTPITLNQIIPANIGTDGDLVVGPADVDVYSFTAPASREYQFSTATSQEGSADTVLRIFDAQGNQIAFNDNANPNTTASAASVSMLAGQTYYIGVSGAGAGALSYSALSGAGAAPGSTGQYSFTVADIGPFQRTVNVVSGHRSVYTDAHGNKITVNLSGPGAAQLVFDSTGNIDLGQLVITGTDNSSSLSVRGPASTVGAISVTASLGSLNAPQLTLNGDMTVTGSIRSMRLGSAAGGHTITVGSGSKLSANFGSVSDMSLTSAEPIRAIRANVWTTTGTTRYTITAPSIASIRVSGTFNEDVSTTVLGHMSVDTLSTSTIRAAQSIASVFAGSATGSNIFAGVPTLTTLPTATTDFSGASVLKSVHVSGTFSNTRIAAWHVGNVRLDAIHTANGGTPFGVAANTIQSIRTTANGATQSHHHLFAPLTQIALGGDAVIRLIG